MGDSLEIVRDFPEDVKDTVGRELLDAQEGNHPRKATPLRGFVGASVLEIVADHDTDTYRVVYTVRFRRAIYVLHAFQKKSKHGIKTSQKDIKLIEQRLAAAEADYRERFPDKPSNSPEKPRK